MLYVQYMTHSNGYLHIILFCSIMQSMFQEFNKKVIQNKLLQRNYVLSSTDKHVKVCRPYIN